MQFDRMIVCTVISCFGLWVHELYRVPQFLGFTPDSSFFMFVIAAALAYWWHRSHGAAAAASLFAYAAISLVGGALSALPLAWLPFKPDQTVDHYAVHVVYAVAQLPLMSVALNVVLRRGAAAR